MWAGYPDWRNTDLTHQQGAIGRFLIAASHGFQPRFRMRPLVVIDEFGLPRLPHRLADLVSSVRNTEMLRDDFGGAKQPCLELVQGKEGNETRMPDLGPEPCL